MTAKIKVVSRFSDDRPPLTDDDGEVRELTADDFKHFRPMREVFPEFVEAFTRARGQRGPQKAPRKVRLGLRLDPEIVAHFGATGPGWQRRISDVLADYVRRGGR